ncbi:MAG: DUF4846 domain-containing protein, partial [Phycisphaerae bacterium]
GDRTIAPGDIFLRPGPRGHALMVLDLATDARGGVRMLLGEGGRPAQTFHVLRSDHGSPWFPVSRSLRIDLAARGRFALRHLRRWVPYPESAF